MAQHRIDRIAVGLDPWPDSLTAVDWAVAEARRGHATLVLVHAKTSAFHRPPVSAGGTQAHPAPLSPHREPWQIVADAADAVRAADPAQPVSVHVVPGDPVDVLVAQSGVVDMVVLGTHRGPGAHEMVQGSIPALVATRADCPVVVVRGLLDAISPGAPVVVGVDGTAWSMPAVRFAAARAAAWEVPLRVVHGWHAYDEMAADSDREGIADRAEQRRKWIGESVAGLAEDHPQLRIDRVLGDGGPVGALLVESMTARLLVVGSRGRRVPAGLLGSVSQAVLRDAGCPVSVVRAR